jgi:hypothetical protein
MIIEHHRPADGRPHVLCDRRGYNELRRRCGCRYPGHMGTEVWVGMEVFVDTCPCEP